MKKKKSDLPAIEEFVRTVGCNNRYDVAMIVLMRSLYLEFLSTEAGQGFIMAFLGEDGLASSEEQLRSFSQRPNDFLQQLLV